MRQPPDGRLPQQDLTLPDEVPGDGYSAEIVPNANLEVVSGPNTGMVFQLMGAEMVIGRGLDATVRLDDASVSTQHAKILRNGGRHLLVDLGSRNGTFLNDRRLTNTPVALSPGSSIRVAETTLVYRATVLSSEPERTNRLANVWPQATGTTGFGGPQGLSMGEVQLLAHLLQSTAPPPEVAPKGPSLEDQLAKLARLWAAVRRNWVPLVVATALCALIGAVSGMLNPPPVEVNVRLRMSAKAPAENPLQRAENDDGEFYAAAEENFMSPILIENTLRSLEQRKPHPFEVNYTAKSLTFKAATQTSLTTYQGTFTHRQPDFALRFLRRHVENFFASEVQRTIHVTQAEVEFLTGRVKQSEDELRRFEEELKGFKEKHLDGLPEHTQDLISTREALLTRRAQLSAEASRASMGLEQARKNLSEETPLASRRAEQAQPFEQSLIDVRRRMGEARAKGLGEEHPEVVSLRKQSEELERLAAQARAGNVTNFERDSNADLAALRHRVGDYQVASKAAGAELGELNEQLQRIEGIVKKMPEVEARYAELTRSYASTKDLHSKLFERLRSSQLQLDLERTSAKARYEVLAPPTAAPLQLRKAILMKAIFGMAAGFCIGIAIVIVLELRRYLRERRAQSTAIVRVPGQTGSIITGR